MGIAYAPTRCHKPRADPLQRGQEQRRHEDFAAIRFEQKQASVAVKARSPDARVAAFCKRLRRTLDKRVRDFASTCPLILALRHPSMRNRHWQALMVATGKNYSIENCHCPRPPGAFERPSRSLQCIGFCTARLHGRAGRFTARF